MKTKALISFEVTAKLICVFVFTYAKSRFPHDVAHISSSRKHLRTKVTPDMHLKLVSHWDAITLDCDRDIYSIILTTVVRHSRECLMTFVRASHDCETFARVSHDSSEIFARASHDIRASVSRRSCEF